MPRFLSGLGRDIHKLYVSEAARSPRKLECLKMGLRALRPIWEGGAGEPQVKGAVRGRNPHTTCTPLLPSGRGRRWGRRGYLES